MWHGRPRPCIVIECRRRSWTGRTYEVQTMVESPAQTAKAATKSRRQFGLKHLLSLMVLAAAGIVGWQKFLYVHPAHRNMLYEKAPYTRSGFIDLEHCKISMESVARSDRNGTVFVEDGFGAKIATAAKHGLVLKNSGPWLDTAQIELAVTDGGFEVLESRVFDFENRETIDEIEPYSGTRMSDPTTLQIYRLGKKLPDQVDVFLLSLIHI